MAFQPSSLFLLCFLAFILLLPSCQRPSLPKERALTDYFRLQVLTDTLLVEISEETEVPEAGDTIPNALFFSVIPPTLLQEIDYLADSAGAVVLGRQHFPLESDVEAYWVEIRQFWFKHHSLLVYDKTHKIFTDRITIAEWYGGDGGQVLIGSWLFDVDGDEKTDILRRDIQHSLVPDGETILERTEESAALLLWKNKQFTETPLPDTAAAVRRYPIRTLW
ncbi:MAG: hypothetical protein SH848_17405 [Saprospiraceae bacterium]|nr:hypothetical protein [Saprospiraceae bacterium]MDZ4705708.1 hypothetical protein [Saprospiraceae bacterium]